MKPISQEDAGPIRLRARNCYCRGDIATAIGIQRSLVEATRDDAHPGDYLFLGTMLWASGDYGAVRDVMLQAHALWPDEAHFIDTIGVCEAHLQRWREAIPWLERGLDLNPDNANLHDSLARILGELGDAERSREHGETSLLLKDALTAGQPPAVDLGTVPVPPFRTDTPDRNVIAFSLFGAHERYCRPALENARVAPHLYPGWSCRFYCDASVPEATRGGLLAAGAQVVLMPEPVRLFEGLFWRFLVANDPGVDRYIVRDCDSLLNLREQRAVAAWIESGRHFHVMRDYFSHTDLMLAGMWGGVRGALPALEPLYIPYLEDASKTANCDQRFLRRQIWPTVRHSVCTHDSAFRVLGAKPFPADAGLPPDRHVGQNMVAWKHAGIGHMTDRSGQDAPLRRRGRFVFALTTTCGEAEALAALLRANLTDGEVHHRRDGPGDLGTRTPEASVIERFHRGGRLRDLREFWRRKFALDLHGATATYAETNPALPLAGAIECADVLDPGQRLDIVAVRRPPLQILRELLADRETAQARPGPDPVLLDPGHPQHIVDPAPYLEAGRPGLCLWYATEIAARAAYYLHLLRNRPTVRIHWVGLDALRTPAGAAGLLAALGQPCEPAAIRLPPELKPAACPEPGDDREILDLIARFPVQAGRAAQQFLEAGGRIGARAVSGRRDPVQAPNG